LEADMKKLLMLLVIFSFVQSYYGCTLAKDMPKYTPPKKEESTFYSIGAYGKVTNYSIPSSSGTSYSSSVNYSSSELRGPGSTRKIREIRRNNTYPAAAAVKITD